jgi:DNA invertase Pin-like site-specific DNA recombinase
LKYLRKGDKVVVYKLDRISRSTKHLIELADHFESMNIDFVSIQDNIDTSTAMGRFFFRMMASMAELERDIIIERTRAGLEAARSRGKHGGRPSADQKKLNMAYQMYLSKEYPVHEICKELQLGRSTLYRFIEQKKSKSTIADSK